MGQRLNIEFIYDDKVIASAYYHYSGYTVTALKELSNIHNAINYENIHDKRSAILELVDVFDNKLHELSGVLDGDSKCEVQRYNVNYKPKDVKDRECGLLLLARNDINGFRKNENFRINYDLKNKVIVGNTLIFEKIDVDYTPECEDIYDDITDSGVKYVDFETFDIDNITELIHFYENNKRFKYKGKYYISIIK